MTREQALAALRQLAAGLAPGPACARRLLERVSLADEPEVLRGLLAELGAAALLEDIDGGGRRERVRGAAERFLARAGG